MAQKAFYAAHEAYNINKLKAILFEVRADAFAEAVACCQEVINDRRDNPEKWVQGKNRTVPKIVAVQAKVGLAFEYGECPEQLADDIAKAIRAMKV